MKKDKKKTVEIKMKQEIEMDTIKGSRKSKGKKEKEMKEQETKELHR